MKKKKKKGGTVQNWQLHRLNFTESQIEEVYPGENAKPLIITGTLLEDPTGRWFEGAHIRTSCVVSMNKVSDNEIIVETINTIYKLVGPGDSDVLPDLGNNVLNIFY